MAIRRIPSEPDRHERWLISYADFITLLFAFFVVMFASSQTDKSRVKQIAEAVQRALRQSSTSQTPAVAKVLGGTVDERGIGNAMLRGPGGTKQSAARRPQPSIPELLPSLQQLESSLHDELTAGKVELKLEQRGLVISLRESAFFPSGGDSVAPSMYATLRKLGNTVRPLPNPVQVEGHTDSQPIHNARFKSNWELSSARAIAILNFFCDELDLSRQRFAVVGRADTAPVDSNDTPSGRARNRRVDLVIIHASAAPGNSVILAPSRRSVDSE